MQLGEILGYVVLTLLFVCLVLFGAWLRALRQTQDPWPAGYFVSARVASPDCLLVKGGVDNKAPPSVDPRYIAVKGAGGEWTTLDTALTLRKPNARNAAGWVPDPSALSKGDFKDCCRVLTSGGRRGPAESTADLCKVFPDLTLSAPHESAGREHETFQNVFPLSASPVNASGFGPSAEDPGALVTLIRCGGEDDLPCIPSGDDRNDEMIAGCSQSGDKGMTRLYLHPRTPSPSGASHPADPSVQRCRTAAWLDMFGERGWTASCAGTPRPFSPFYDTGSSSL